MASDVVAFAVPVDEVLVLVAHPRSERSGKVLLRLDLTFAANVRTDPAISVKCFLATRITPVEAAVWVFVPRPV